MTQFRRLSLPVHRCFKYGAVESGRIFSRSGSRLSASMTLVFLMSGLLMMLSGVAQAKPDASSPNHSTRQLSENYLLDRNGDFEQESGKGDRPYYWAVSLPKQDKTASSRYHLKNTETIHAHSKSHCLELANPTTNSCCWFYQASDLVLPKKKVTYEFKVWVKTQGLDKDDHVRLGIALQDKKGGNLKYLMGKKVKGNSDWRPITFDFSVDASIQIKKQQVDHVRLYLFMGGDDTPSENARAWFDDVSLSQVLSP